jgi:hypothetical protein
MKDAAIPRGEVRDCGAGFGLVQVTSSPLSPGGRESEWYKPDTLVTHLLNTWVTGSFLGKEVLPCPGKRPVL